MQFFACYSPPLPKRIRKTLLAIKLTTILLLAIGLTATARDVSKKVTFSKINAGLREVFKEIKNQTGYTFAYSKAQLKKARPINLILRNASLKDALELCFEDQPLDYAIVNKTIVVRDKKEKVFKAVESYMPPPLITIQGKVTNEKGEPLSGATITEKGSNNSTNTKEDGSFSIAVANEKSTLVFSFVGYENEEITIGNQVSITAQLIQQPRAMNEVVVTGYSAQRKKDITGSVAVVNVSNMKAVPAGTVEQALQGQASGVSIVSSGSPGGGSAIRIRGITSMGNVQPLVIIDGVQGNLTDLNANDIESIQVLKDASASIYGVRGANGVIVVTSKKGRQGKAKFSYDGYVGVQTAGKGIENVTPQEYGEALWTAQRNSGVANPSNPQYGNGPAPILPDYLFPRGAKEGDPGTDPSTYNLATNPITRANKAGTDWLGEITRPALMTSHTVTASGGSDKNSYLFSFGYLNQQGTLIETYLKRYSVRANTQFSFKDRLRIGENAYVFFKDNPSLINGNLTEGNSISQALFASNILPVYDIVGNYVGDRLTTVFGDNTVAAQKRTRDNKSNDWQIQGNVFAELDILKGLTARTSIGGVVDNFYNYAFNYTRYEHSTQSNAANSFTETSGFNSSQTFTNTLTYTKAFGDHDLKVLAGSEYVSQYARAQVSTRGRYYSTDPNFWTLNSGDPTTQSNSNLTGTPFKSRIFSLFSRLDYAFSDKYLLSATVRRDGSSVFAPENRYGVFPAASAGWRVSKEHFMESLKWINDLKIRTSWGSLGSISNINPTNPYNLYSSGAGTSNYDINGASNATMQGFYASQYGNVSTTWEKDIITNIGLDANLFDSKVDLTVEWYKKKIEGLLFRPSIPATAGGGLAPFVNLGDIQNTGIDVNGTYRGKLTKDFSFDVSGNITVYKTKVVKLPFEYIEFGSVRNGTPVRVREGFPIGTFFGYKVIGLFQNDQEVSKSPVQDQAAPGRFKYADINGDNTITDADRTMIGNPNPDFTYGVNISLRYKDFDFSTFLYGSQGNDIFNAVKYYNYFPFQNFQGALAKDAYVNAWTSQNTNTTIPKLETSSNFSTSGVVNSFYIENGSYLRCKQMMLGYNFPKATLNKWGIDRLRVYIQAANLFTITKYSGLDPEVSGSNVLSTTVFGLDLGNYPTQRTFLVGLNLGF